MDDTDTRSKDENSPAPGASLPGRYQIKKVIGRGGIGVVFQANDLKLSRDVAIKILVFEGPHDAEMQERFLREARALASLDHPNIVKFFSSGFNDAGDPFHVMELLKGCSLAEEISRSGKLPPARFFEIFKQVLSGLSHAHGNEIVHRDLKPANIMLCTLDNAQTTVKIIDFGSARVLVPDGEGHALTRTNTLPGSPPYMSPEQCRGQRGDKQSDIYSLGCIMYECLSGEAPFQGESALDIMYKHMSQQAPGLSEIDRTEPGKRLAALVAHCLEKEPLKRPPSVEEISDSLAQIFAGGNLKHASFNNQGRSSWFAKTLGPPAVLLVLATCAATFSFHSLSTHKDSAVSSSEPLKDTPHQMSILINRLKRTASRSKSCFDGVDPKKRPESEETQSLLKALQNLAHAQMKSGLTRDLKEATATCTTQIAVSKSVGNSGRAAAGYILRGQAESLLGEYGKASQDFAECKKIVLQVWGTGSSQWHDYLLDECIFNLRQQKLKEAEKDLINVFQIWNDSDEANPKKGINRAPYLDQDGPDKYTLVVNCLKTLEKADLNSPEDAATALSMSNLLTLQTLDFKLTSASSESMKFSLTLLPRIPAGYDELTEQTRALIKEHPIH